MNFYDSILIGGYNSDAVLFVFLIWVAMLCIVRPMRTFTKPYQNNISSNIGLYLCLFMVICVLGLHRWDTYHIENILMHDYDHLEPFHRWLRINTKSTLLYRVVVFGLSTLLYFHIAKRLKIYNLNFCLACTLFLADSMFCEMRGVVGHVCLLLGYVLLLDNNPRRHRIIDVIVGCIFIICSFYMHRSIWICIILAMISLIKFDKKSIIIISWILFPILSIVVSRYWEYALQLIGSINFMGDLGIVEHMNYYIDSNFSFGEYNMVGKIVNFICDFASYVIFFYLSYNICFKNIKLDKIYTYLFRWYYVCAYLGWLLSSIETNDWIGTRVTVMALFPMPLILAKVWGYERKSSIYTKLIVVFGIIGCMLEMFIRYRNWGSL